MDLSLDRIQLVLSSLGHPQDNYTTIHVAGTNGKGSICAILESILVASQLKVGKFTSPHLLNVEECLRINKKCIDKEDLSRLRKKIQFLDLKKKASLTNFEILTAAMFLWFSECKVDIAIIEVGLGGALDATNVLKNTAVCVFSSIGLDHEKVLGSSIAEICKQKVGILKPHVPAVISYQTEPQALESLLEACNSMNSPFIVSGVAKRGAGDKVTYKTRKGNVFNAHLPLQGDFQLANLACALETIETINTGFFEVLNSAITLGIESTIWPGRAQWISSPLLPRILLDGAHNPAAARAFRNYLDALTLPPDIHWVFACTDGKDYKQLLEALLTSNSRSNNHFYVVGFKQPTEMPWITSLPSSKIVSYVETLEKSLVSTVFQGEFVDDALEEIRSRIQKKSLDNSILVITGSLYLVADALKHLNWVLY